MTFDYTAALQSAKDATSIAEAWRILRLPGQCPAPGRGGKSPLRDDRHGGSFTISKCGKMFCDHAFREHAGDVVRFIELATSTDFKGARAQLFEFAGIEAPERNPQATFVAPPKPLERHSVEYRELPELPEMSTGTPEQRAALAKLRGLRHVSGVELAVKYGHIRFCTAYNHECWAVLDPGTHPCNVQVRRMDGGKFGEKKTLGFTGNWGTWPVGTPTMMKYPRTGVLLVEGAPDYLAACDAAAQLVTRRLPVSMFGATQPIHEGALPLFTGMDVLIVPHNDENKAGEIGARAWEKQLADRATVKIKFLPPDVKDLNDLLLLSDEAVAEFFQGTNQHA